MDLSHLERRLSEARSCAESGDFAGAVNAVRGAKALAPKNVYILAFERQAEQLSELNASHSLTEEQRTDILESIPAIIERALESSRSPGMVTGSSALRAGADALQEKKEKAAALEWLKNQYFQHAHEYIRKGEYEHALAEIRRVYIIDPENSIARDFEKQFEALARLKKGDSTRSVQGLRPARETTAPVSAAPPPPSPAEREEPEATPTMTDEWSSPRQVKRQEARAVHPQPERAPGRKKGNTLIVILIVIALGILAAVIYYYYQRSVYRKPQITSFPASTEEQFIGAPSETEEQSFLVSAGDTTSGSPQVTELHETPVESSRAGESPPPRTVRAPSLRPAGGAARGDTRSPEQQPEPSPPLMATQAQPEQKDAAVQPRSADTARPAPFVAVEKEARIIRLERPKFPAQDALAGFEGQVVVQVEIDATGKPVQTVTLKSTNDLLIQPVVDAVMASQFAPAEMTGGPVASWLTIPFRFTSKQTP